MGKEQFYTAEDRQASKFVAGIPVLHAGQPASDDPGATKADVGKPRWSLLMGAAGLALLEIIKVLEFGAKKYSPGGWQKVPGGYGRYKDALYRHLHSIEENGPLATDPETGLLEWAHVGCNVVFLIWYVVTGKAAE